jgi:Icc protein
MTAMSRRIVQLTDGHLFADPNRALRDTATWPRFIAVLEDVRRRALPFDLLVLSGDTAHDEGPATYRAARKELGEWADRVRAVPGNHDQRAGLAEAFPAAGGVAERVTFHERWRDWQAIGLDTQRPGELPGSLGNEQLAWLDGLLGDARLPTLLFMHHPPVDVQSPWLDAIKLQDAAEFAGMLSRHPHARLVSCGHVHQETASSLGGIAVLTTPAVGPQFRPRTAQLEIDPGPPAYRLIELHAAGEWSSQVLRCTASQVELARAEIPVLGRTSP